MNFSAIFRSFLRISAPEKTVFLGAVLAAVATILPWFERANFVEKNGTFSEILTVGGGFSFFPIFGFLALFFAIFEFIFLARNIAGFSKTLGVKNAVGAVFSAGEAVFAIFIAFFVFATAMKNDATAAFRFGFFVEFLAQFFAFFGAVFWYRADREREKMAALRPPVSPGHLGRVPEKQLSLSDLNDRK